MGIATGLLKFSSTFTQSTMCICVYLSANLGTEGVMPTFVTIPIG